MTVETCNREMYLKRLSVLAFVFLLLLFLFAIYKPEETPVQKYLKLKQINIIGEIVKINPLKINDEDFKKEKDLKNIPAFAVASDKVAAHLKYKTAICETDDVIGQDVLCSLHEETPCDSDSLQYYKNFTEMAEKERLEKNLSDWTILFPRRDPVEKLVDHFIDVCVREARDCFECRMNLKCYLTKIYSAMKNLAENIEQLTDDQKKFIPQNWFCQMETMARRFEFVDYQKFAKPINPEFADSKRPDDWQPWGFFENPISAYDKIREYFVSFITSRPDVLELVKKIYYWDYLILKFPFPELKESETV